MEVYNAEDVGQRRIYCFVVAHIVRRSFTSSFLGMETFHRKLLFDGVYEYVVISFKSSMEDEGRVGGRDLTIDVLS